MENENKNPELTPEEQWFNNILNASSTDELDAVLSPPAQEPTQVIPSVEEFLLPEMEVSHMPQSAVEPAVEGDPFLLPIDLEEPASQVSAGEPVPEEDPFLLPIDLEEPVSQAPVAEPAPREASAPSKKSAPVSEEKGRPKWKKGYGLFGIPHIVSTIVWLGIILVLGVSLGHMIWACCSDLMAFGKADKAITITITETDDIDSISQKLADAGLISYPNLFKTFATLTHKDEDIDPGTYTLNSYYDYNAMINGMQQYAPSRKTITLLIPEGYTCAQTFRLLEENGVCNAEDLETYAASGELKEYWFLDGIDRGSKYCLEGFLFPDTYEFYLDSEPQLVLEKMLDGFNYRFTDIMKEDFKTMQERYASMMASRGYSSDHIATHELTLHDVVILASIIEKETANNSESYDIASVFYNRLTNPNYPTLGSDATVHYAIGDYYGEIEELTAAHLATDSPYNTRKNGGLPPGAICNPGTYSLYAALDPNDTSYYYFVYDPSIYMHRFAKNESEHNQNVARLNN